jgi:hypothetical protein
MGNPKDLKFSIFSGSKYQIDFEAKISNLTSISARMIDNPTWIIKRYIMKVFVIFCILDIFVGGLSAVFRASFYLILVSAPV